MAPTLQPRLPTQSPSSRARNTRTYNDNYAADAGRGSQTFAGSETWRRALLGTAAAGALMFGYGRRAYAQVTPPNAPCNQISGGGTIVTCTGDVSTGVLLTNAGGAYTTLNVNTLTANITPASGVHGIEFTSNGDITINSNTGTYSISVTGADTDGIHAASVNGSVTIDSTGNVTSAAGHGIYARDTTGDILVTNDGAVTAEMNAIDAQATNGAVTVDSTGDITSNAGIAIVAKSQGAGNVSVASNGNLSGTAMTSGIYARGVTGTVTVNTSGDIGITGGVPTFGILANSGTSSDISVTSVGNIVGQSVAIAAQSATGSATIDSTGSITSDAYGLFAYSGGAGAVSLTSNGTVLAGTTALNAQSAGGGVTVDSTGALTATTGFGIYARDTTGAILVTNDGAVTAEMNAIDAQATDGAVTVDSTGDITSNAGIAIVAKSQGAGNVSVTSNGNLSGTAMTSGIYARGVTGTVTVNSTGNIGATGGVPTFGILANTPGTGDVTVTSQGDVSAANGVIAAQSTGGGVTINSTGNLTGTAVGIVAATSGGGAISVTSIGSITAATNDAVHIEGGASSDVGLVGGVVHGGDDGVDFVGGGANKLTNLGTLSGDNLAIRGTTGDETVENYGIITGSVDLGTGANAFYNRAGATFNSGAIVTLGAGNQLTNAGNLSPGGTGAVQTTALTGKIVQTGTGTFTVDVAGASADRIDASGSADLAGTVAVNVVGTPTASEYIILTAAGGVTNLGLGLTSPALRATLLFPDPFTVVLGILDVDFSVDGLNRNERALANYMNVALAAGEGGLGPVMTGLLNVGDLAAYKHALDQLLPEIYSDEQIASLFAHLAFAGNLLSCRVNGTDTAAIIHEGQCLWAGANAGFLDTDSTFQLLGFNETAGRFAAGAQVAIDPVWRLGFGAGYQSSTLETATTASADGQVAQGGVALKYNPGRFLLAGVLSGGRSWYDTKRPMAFGGFAATAQGNAEIDTLNGGLRLAYVFGSPELYFKPVMDAAVTRVDLHGLTETGGGAANLAVRGETPTVYSFAPSIEMGTEWWLSDRTLIRPFLRAGATWFTNTYFGLNSTFVAAPGGVAPFLTITGMDDVMGTVGAGLDVITENDTVLHVSYDGQLGQTTQIHSVSLKGSARF